MGPDIQHLLGMGFSVDIAAQALEANGGNLLRATDWLLNHIKPSNQHRNQNTNPSSPIINRFFNLNNKREQNTTKTQTEIEEEEEEEEEQSQMSLNRKKRQKPADQQSAPLSERMRPRVIEDVIGQDHLLAGESLLRAAVDSGRLPSIILYGPPGTGKTSIAGAIANSCSDSYKFVSLSAVNSTVKEIRESIDEAKKSKLNTNKRTLLFLDEVHRFNKSQQNSFLPVIEDGSIIFIGATTENPSFHLITPLLSRCTILTLNPLKSHHVKTLINRSLSDFENGIVTILKGAEKIELNEESINFLSLHCDGNARVALNALEISATNASNRNNSENRVMITIDGIKEALQSDHYNPISALIKSMRESDGNASIYWLAKMLEGGEEPLYIARRLVRFASEDVGLADPQALTQAVSCYQACHFLGMPECNVNLAHCVVYLALAKKSVAVYCAIRSAIKVVKESVVGNEVVPLHLRNATSKLQDNLEDKSQSYLPDSLKGYKFLDWP